MDLSLLSIHTSFHPRHFFDRVCDETVMRGVMTHVGANSHDGFGVDLYDSTNDLVELKLP